MLGRTAKVRKVNAQWRAPGDRKDRCQHCAHAEQIFPERLPPLRQADLALPPTGLRHYRRGLLSSLGAEGAVRSDRVQRYPTDARRKSGGLN